MTQHPDRVVILGAGYAGLLATARLAGRMKREVAHGRVTITLVNAADVFVERLRLHQLAANRPIEQRPIASILQGAGITFVRGTVTRIDVARRRLDVQTDSGVQSQEYDYLIYALGSTIDRDSVPGVREHAYVLTPEGPRSAPALRQTLSGLPVGAQLPVCGGGATGIEAAAEFAEAYPSLTVQLVTQGAPVSLCRPRSPRICARRCCGWASEAARGRVGVRAHRLGAEKLAVGHFRAGVMNNVPFV